jgi:quinoprotein glucose dehydrogenase
MRRFLTCAGQGLAVVLALIAASATLRSQTTASGEWRSWGADQAATRYSPLDQINTRTVKDLKVAWRQSAIPDEVKATAPDLPNLRAAGNFQNTPLMVGGLLYMSTGLGTVAALDAGNGKVVWFDKAAHEATVGANRGVAYWSDGRDARIIAIAGQYLVALNAQTGTRYDAFGIHGEVDLRLGASKPLKAYSWRSSPIVVRNVIVVGSLVPDINNAQMASYKESPPGDVRGYDVRTGKQLWTFHTIPQPGEVGNETWLKDSWAYTGHTNVWGAMSADEALGYVYLPLTTPTDDWYGGHRPGAGLFGESIVALDARTGRRVWHFQGVHHGLWDYDFPCPPVLVDITVNGRRIKALAQPSKQAFLYVLDRTNGTPVWPIEERPAPKGDVPGEWYSPTQPIPLDAHGKPFAYDLQGVSADNLIDFTPQLRAEALGIISKYAYGPIFFPIVVPGQGIGADKQGSIHFPGTYGGTNWPGAALDPETNVLYVPSAHTPIFAKAVAPDASHSDLNYVREGFEAAKGPEGLPLFKPPYGRLVAIDLNRGEIKWTVANGDGPRNHPALKDLHLPPLGNPGRVGPLVTKTLVFMGEGYNTNNGGGPPFGGGKTFRAFDKRDGTVVWETALEGGATAPAMTYSWQGRQYVVTAVGWTDHPGELFAFALDDKPASR